MPGASDGNERTDPITPEVRALDAINPTDIAISAAREAGFTTIYTLPGSANLIGGTGTALKLRGHTADEMIIPGTEMMKFALGENPRRVYGSNNRMPATRMGNAALIRKTLFEAKNYSDALKKFENGEGDKPKPDFKLDALVPAIRGEMKCRIHAHRNDDIMCYNEAALALMVREGIAVNDLYSVVAPHIGEYICDDLIHPTDAGKAALAQAVADKIKEALQ
jgi:imidazolonepropionase-like amidohydrolase